MKNQEEKPSTAQSADDKAARFWPRLIFGFLAFVVVVNSIFIWLAINNSSHLVQRDYYEQSMLHDEKMNRLKLADKMGLELKLEKNEKRFEVTLSPGSIASFHTSPGELDEWTLQLYRPEDPELDQIVNLFQMSDKKQNQSSETMKRWWSNDLKLKPGKWEVVLRYSIGSEKGEKKFHHWEKDNS